MTVSGVRQILVAAAAAAPPLAPLQPTWRRQLANFAVFQWAWFAAVVGAAHGWPLAGTACVLVAIGWHVAVSARPAFEARLVSMVCAIGLVAETLVVWQGNIAYPSGQPVQWLPPYWMVALWGLLAIALNVTCRWLHQRHWLAALVGAVAGPLSFVGGVRLGGASFIHERPALMTMVGMWAVLMPSLLWLAQRNDGVSVRVNTPVNERATEMQTDTQTNAQPNANEHANGDADNHAGEHARAPADERHTQAP